MPSMFAAELSFLAIHRSDLPDSIISASIMFMGRSSPLPVFFPKPLTMKLLRPYSRLKQWATMELSPTLVVWSTISSMFPGLAKNQSFFRNSAIARSAFPRCEIVFFCSSLISERVRPESFPTMSFPYSSPRASSSESSGMKMGS